MSTEPLVERGSSQAVENEYDRLERRRLIRSAVAAVPVVLTFTAGTARAQAGSVMDSGASDAPEQDELEGEGGNSKASEDEESDSLSPSEELETFGLKRVERPEGYSDNPFRDLDSAHPPVDTSGVGPFGQ